MAVEDVNKPKTVKEVDPRAAAEKGEGSVAYWEGKAAAAKARLDYQDYVNAMQQLGRTPEPGFQVKGTVNLGDINPQQAAKEAQERADKAMESKDKDIKDANEKAAQAESKLQEERINSLRQDFSHQMGELNKTIEKLGTAKDTRPLHEQFKEQYTALLGVAKDLGMEKTSTGRDPMVDIKLSEMSYENAMREREFQLKMKADDRQWQMDLQKLQDEREHRQAELAQKAKRDEMIFTAPAAIGAALAKGVRENAEGRTSPGGVSRAPQQHQIELGPGEVGDIECPYCHTMIGVGPESVTAQCVGCKQEFPVVRVTAAEVPAGTAQGPPEPDPSTYEEEK